MKVGPLINLVFVKFQKVEFIVNMKANKKYVLNISGLNEGGECESKLVREVSVVFRVQSSVHV